MFELVFYDEQVRENASTIQLLRKLYAEKLTIFASRAHNDYARAYVACINLTTRKRMRTHLRECGLFTNYSLACSYGQSHNYKAIENISEIPWRQRFAESTANPQLYIIYTYLVLH